MTQASGAHGLGPHVVGRRVVVRRRLDERGPTGGPAFTDVLGTCLSWTPGGTCVVQPDDGPAVTIPLADVVSGKPVPPRPSPRHRVSPHDAQQRGGVLFDDLVTEPLGAWTVRHSRRHAARRANSVLAFGSSGLEPDDELARVLAAYPSPARPVVAVLADSPEQTRFEAAGWGPESNDGDTVFQLASVAAVSRALRTAGVRAPDDVRLEVTAPATVTARVVLDGEPVAGGVAAYRDDWVGVRSLEVAPASRRHGWGLVVMHALLGWGAEQGATTAFLQVLGDNGPALSLYARLGFVPHHAYRYLAPPRGAG